MKIRIRLAALFALITVCLALGDASEGIQDFIGQCLVRAQYYQEEALKLNQAVFNEPCPNTWEGFLHDSRGRWSLDEKKAAFTEYLSITATNDCQAVSGFEKAIILLAICQCDNLCHTNCVPAMMNLATNPRGVYRDKAAKVAIKFGDFDSNMLHFVESIATNRVEYSTLERCRAVISLWERIESRPPNDGTRMSAIRLLYRIRAVDAFVGVPCDTALNHFMDDYSMSSNRLLCACEALRCPGLSNVAKKYYVSVTNQLLSSGQPIRWINVGGTNE